MPNDSNRAAVYLATLANWQVRVYLDGAQIDSWRIENRTEDEARQEAEADVNKMDPDCDWTLTIEGNAALPA